MGRIAVPAQRGGVSGRGHADVSRARMASLPGVAITDLNVATAAGNEYDQVIAGGGSDEFLRLWRILIGPDQQRAPTGSPSARCHFRAQISVCVETGNHCCQFKPPGVRRARRALFGAHAPIRTGLRRILTKRLVKRREAASTSVYRDEVASCESDAAADPKTGLHDSSRKFSEINAARGGFGVTAFSHRLTTS